MSALDELMAAVEGSTKLDAGTKAVLGAFLREGGPAVGTLAPQVLQDVIGQVASGRRAAAIESLASSFSAEQVTALLEVTQSEMDKTMEARDANRAAGQALLTALGSAALSVMMRAIISAL